LTGQPSSVHADCLVECFEQPRDHEIDEAFIPMRLVVDRCQKALGRPVDSVAGDPAKEQSSW
jgi:hypothetical protein